MCLQHRAFINSIEPTPSPAQRGHGGADGPLLSSGAAALGRALAVPVAAAGECCSSTRELLGACPWAQRAGLVLQKQS